MRHHRTFKISETTEKYMRDCIEKAALDLREQMKISGIDSLRVSIDINEFMSGPPVGIKINATKIEQAEILYDGDFKKKGVFD